MEDIAVNQILILFLQCLIVGSLLLILFRLRTIFGMGLLFTALGVFQYMQVFLAASLYIEVIPGLMITPGSMVMFTGSLFAILLIYIREDALEARKVIYALLAANLVLAFLQIIFSWAIDGESVTNIYNLPKEFFGVNARVLAVGTLVLFIDAFLIIFIYETFARFISFFFLRILISMIVVLSIDSLLFSIGAFIGSEQFVSILFSGLVSKITSALIYSTMFYIYLIHLDKGFSKDENESQAFEDIFHTLTYRQKYEQVFHEKETHRKDLESSEKRFQLLTENSRDMIYRMSLPDGVYEYVSPASNKIFGYTPDEFISNPLLIKKALHPNWHNYFKEQWEFLLKGNIPNHYEYQIIHGKTDETKWINQRNVLIRDNDEKIIAIEGIVTDVTERKNAEVVIAETASNLTSLLDNRQDSIWSLDTNYNYIIFNKTYADIFFNSYKKELKKGMNALDTLQPELHEFWTSKYDSAFKGESHVFEFTHEFDGEIRYFEVSLNPIISNETVTGVSAITSDITDRRRAEELIKLSEYNFRTIFEESTDGIMLLDEKSDPIEVNEKICEILGYTKEEIMALNATSFIHPEDMKGKHHEEAIQKLMDGETIRITYRLKQKSGNYIFAELSTKILEQGRFLNIIRDITKEKLSKENLKKFADRLEILHEIDLSILAAKSPKAIAQYTLEGLRKFIPYKFAVVVEYDRELKQVTELASIPFNKSMDNEERLAPIFDNIRDVTKTLKAGKTHLVKNLKTKKDKSVAVDLLASQGINSCFIIPLIAEGQLIGALNLSSGSPDSFSDEMIEIANEIANQLAVSIKQWQLKEEILNHTKDLEEKIIERTAQLEYSNKELRDFAQIVSHDLKAPLRAISQLSYWVSQDYADKIDEEGQEKLRLLTGRVQRLDSLIEGILQYSRAGKLREKEIKLNFHTLVHDVLNLLAPPKNIEVIIENQLPEYKGDPTRFGQLFQNLISNAIKFMDKEQGIIKIGHTELDGFFQFYVADNGPGIEEKYFGRIFQIFQRLVSRDQQEGTGVGLSLAKRIVQIYGGEIWLESEPGEGSTFYFTLPINQTKKPE